MRNDHYEFLTILDTETERYSLVHLYRRGWFAQMETLMGDGTWHRAWYSEEFPNQAGAHLAIRNAFGL
jgi:hypothetical protein